MCNFHMTGSASQNKLEKMLFYHAILELLLTVNVSVVCVCVCVCVWMN